MGGVRKLPNYCIDGMARTRNSRRSKTHRGATLLVIAQCPKPFSLGRSPTMPVLGDDMDQSLGPNAFHLPSVRRALREAGAAIIVSSGPLLLPYETVGTTAVLGRRHAVLIETREQHEKPLARSRPAARSESENNAVHGVRGDRMSAAATADGGGATDAAKSETSVAKRACEGDMTAARLILERIAPLRRRHPVRLKLPEIRCCRGHRRRSCRPQDGLRPCRAQAVYWMGTPSTSSWLLTSDDGYILYDTRRAYPARTQTAPSSKACIGSI
jgi:hypothetical protein